MLKQRYKGAVATYQLLFCCSAALNRPFHELRMPDRPCGAGQHQSGTPVFHSSMGSESSAGQKLAPKKEDFALEIDKGHD